jgi:ABC-type bacteriocin/lantibiotic exporter with double-glycine peptidase domain
MADKEPDKIESTSAADVTKDSGIIVCKNLTKKFGNLLVLDNISLAIEPHKTTVVIGYLDPVPAKYISRANALTTRVTAN